MIKRSTTNINIEKVSKQDDEYSKYYKHTDEEEEQINSKEKPECENGNCKTRKSK
jgi:hypothetical protein